jgi:alpha-glucosidase
MKKYKIIFLMFMAVFTATMAAATGYKLVSPNGRLMSEINVGDSLTFTLSDERQSILSPSTIAIEWTDGTVWGAGMKVRKAQRLSMK